MIVIYNGTSKILVLKLSKDLNERHIYYRMAQHGMRTSYSQWIVPGTIEA